MEDDECPVSIEPTTESHPKIRKYDFCEYFRIKNVKEDGGMDYVHF